MEEPLDIKLQQENMLPKFTQSLNNILGAKVENKKSAKALTKTMAESRPTVKFLKPHLDRKSVV